MYFVNRSEMEQILDYFEKVMKELDNRQIFTNNVLNKFAIERMIQVMTESILDVGNKMIDGFIMRDPGSYHDIIDILIDEGVLPKEDEKSYKNLIDMRKLIVREYITNDLTQLQDVMKYMPVLKQFPNHIRLYLDMEMGVANAFSNESKVGDSDEA